MSVNAKMTAIADKIRTLDGKTGPLSLDAMAEDLDEVKADLNRAFSAVGERGGTVPAVKTSENLPEAIGTIPEYIPVRRVDSTFTIQYDANWYTYVDCGFQPDIVLFPDFNYVSDAGNNCEYQAAFVFSEKRAGYTMYADAYTRESDGSWHLYQITISPTDTGFRTYAWGYWDDSGNFVSHAGQTWRYIAIKYTA